MRSNQVAQVFIHLTLKNIQGLRLYNLFGQSGLLPVFVVTNFSLCQVRVALVSLYVSYFLSYHH